MKKKKKERKKKMQKKNKFIFYNLLKNNLKVDYYYIPNICLKIYIV